MPLECAPTNMLNCYRNFGDDDDEELNNNDDINDSYELVAQVDLMFQTDHPPVQIEGVWTFPLNPDVPPDPIAALKSSSLPSDNGNNFNTTWKSFATAVSEQSNQFLHHRSKELAFLYFGVLILFIILLTAVKYFCVTSLGEAIGIGTCLVAILAFVVAFNRLPIWHDAALDDKILELTSRQPLLSGGGGGGCYYYYLTYVRDNPSEGFMGVTRRIRIYQKQVTYEQPVLPPPHEQPPAAVPTIQQQF